MAHSFKKRECVGCHNTMVSNSDFCYDCVAKRFKHLVCEIRRQQLPPSPSPRLLAEYIGESE